MNESAKTHHDFADYIDILSTRYANGEITREEFEKQSEDLFRMDAVRTYLETMAETSKLSESKACVSREDQTMSGWLQSFCNQLGLFGIGVYAILFVLALTTVVAFMCLP